MIALWFVAGASASDGALAEVVALHLGRDGRRVDQATIAPAYEAVCTAGSELACRWRAWDDWGRPDRADLARITGPVCDQGDLEACLLLAWAVGTDDAGAWNRSEEVAAPLRASCDGGIARACSELGTWWMSGALEDPDPEVARQLHERACSTGATVGCDRAASRRWPEGLAADEACNDGWGPACATLSAPTLEQLERWCHVEPATGCLPLATARRDHPLAIASERPIRAAWIVPGGVLLEHEDVRFVDHPFVGFTPRVRVELLVGRGRQERLVWVDEGGTRLELPLTSCEVVVDSVEQVAASGRLVRAVDALGAPTSSVCVDEILSSAAPPYLGGSLTVVPDSPEDVGRATTLRAAIAAASTAIFDCAESMSRDVHTDAWSARFAHKGKGTASKVAQATSSGHPALDGCLAAWFSAVELPPADLPARYTILVDLQW